MHCENQPLGGPCAPSAGATEIPFVSIVIPVRNEESFMPSCIRSLRELDYPPDRLEVIFADGRSTDRTAQIARESGYRVVDNQGLKISAGRNVGFAASRGEIVAFTDADCVFDRLWVRNAVRNFDEHPEFAGLSGPTRVPQDQHPFGLAVGVVYELAGMAGGTVHLDCVTGLRETDDLPGCNAFYRREALQTVMPTSTELYAAEDVAMNADLRRRGFRLAMTPGIALWHHKRSSPRRFWKQMYTYAIGRLQVGRQDKSLMKATHWAMGFGVPASVLLLLILGFFWPWILGGAVAAALLTGVGISMAYGLKRSPRVGIWVAVAIGIFVSAWPLGFLREWFRPVPSSGDAWRKGR